MKSIQDKKRIKWLIVICLWAFILATVAASGETVQKGYVNAQNGLNVRTGPGINYEAIMTLPEGTEVLILGKNLDSNGTNWFQVSWDSGASGYVHGNFITIGNQSSGSNGGTSEILSDQEFEADMKKEGFPNSYKPYLRVLHKTYPSWKFKADHTGINWADATAKESKVGLSLVTKTAPSSWKSMEEGAYSFLTDSYISYDSGGWVTGSPMIIEHYMDPRNFLTERGIFQFLTHRFDESTQSLSGLKLLLKGTFMEGNFPESEYETWADALMAAGKKSNVNPYVLASMILVEQGTNGIGGCISGNVSGYEGIYNFFNIGAYRSGKMSAVTRGLWYASQNGSYGRPWNSRYKSILGGGIFYGDSYVAKNQNTLYLKKWNVMNGLANVGTHQYMGNLQGADLEAVRLRKGYLSMMSDPKTFTIPVYKNMPSVACKRPPFGNNNNYLEDLKVEGFQLNKTFNRYQYEYHLDVDNNVNLVTVIPVKSDESATVSGGGKKTLTGKETVIKITVKSSTGMTRQYRVFIHKSADGQSQGIQNQIDEIYHTNIKLSSSLEQDNTGAYKIRLKWTSAHNSVDFYQLHRSTSRYSGYGKQPYYSSQVGSPFTFLNSKIEEGLTYYYKIRGVKEIDGKRYYTKWSNKAWRTVPKKIESPVEPEPTPEPNKEWLMEGVEKTSISAKSQMTKSSTGKPGIKIEWNKSPGYRVSYYEVFRSLKRYSGFGKEPIYRTIDGDKAYYINTKGLDKRKTYYYKVRGVREINGVNYYTTWSNKVWRTFG